MWGGLLDDSVSARQMPLLTVRTDDMLRRYELGKKDYNSDEENHATENGYKGDPPPLATFKLLVIHHLLCKSRRVVGLESPTVQR